MNKSNEQEIRYRLLKILSQDPNFTQRQMAQKMGISLGKINYCLSEFVQKGLIKITRLRDSQNKVRYLYILTPCGLEEKAKVTLQFFKRKIAEYEETKKQIKTLNQEMEEHGQAETTSMELPDELKFVF